MTMPGDQFVKMLQRRTAMEWYRFSGGTGDNGRFVPPLIVWRYKEPVPELEERLSGTIEKYHGRVDWFFGRPGRNWVLAPRRVLDVQRERSLPTDRAAIKLLMAEDQPFCELAVQDFLQLMDWVDSELG
jgi:hypothetical protein